MAEQDVVTGDAVPAVPAADTAQTVTPPEQVNIQLEARLNELTAKVDTLSSTLTAERQANADVVAGYKAALGTAMQQRQVPTTATNSDLASKYDPEVVQLINTQAEAVADRLFNRNLSKLMVQAQAQQSVGTDQDVVKAAEREFQALKSNPYYVGQSDEILQALAAASAKANVQTQRLDAIRQENTKKAGEQALRAQADAGRIPGTAPSNKPTPDNPDADINEYMNDPSTVQAMTKLLGVNCTSDTEISWRGKKVKAKEAFRDIAIRAVRTGVSVSERMRMGAGVPIGQREA